MNFTAFFKGSTFLIVYAGTLSVPLVFPILLTSFSLAADDQATKAVRRASPEGVSWQKGQSEFNNSK